MGWSDLPQELLICICETLTEIIDHIRLRCVRSAWRSALLSLALPPQIPWVVISSGSGKLVSFSENRAYPIRLSNDVQTSENTSFFYGSASGWLLAVMRQNAKDSFSIINPFNGVSISLPSPVPGNGFSCHSILWDRADSIVVYGCNFQHDMFYCHLGRQQSWKPIKSMQNNKLSRITCHRNKFFVMNTSVDRVMILEGDRLEKVLVILLDLVVPNIMTTHYVVTSEESLLLLRKPIGIYYEQPIYFVYEMDLREEVKKWRRVNDIGGRAIFVDKLHCFSVVVDDGSKLRRDCLCTASADGRCPVYSFCLVRGYPTTQMEFSDTVQTELLAGRLLGYQTPLTWIMSSLH